MRYLLAAAILSLLTLSVHGQAAESPYPSSPPTVYANPSLVQSYQASIQPHELAAQLFLFSSDYLEGRETTTRGQKLAAEYLASRYREIGLQPMGDVHPRHPYAPEAYFQPFTVHGSTLREARLAVIAQDDTLVESTFSRSVQDDKSYLSIGNIASIEGSVVFAGYGISDGALGYDDFLAMKDKDISPAGKWLLILRDEPLANDTTSLFPTLNGRPSVWSHSIYQKLRAAYRSGVPKGLLVVDDVGPRSAGDLRADARRAARGMDAVRSLSLKAFDRRLPVYMVSSEFANVILTPSGRTVAEIKKSIDEDLFPIVLELPGIKVTSRIERETFSAETENVLAFLEGADPELRDEIVVISSHYDHIGVDPTATGDGINNGADDNGSGTVAMLEIAEAFAEARRDGYAPRRSILFLHTSAEEKGLLGSQYYADVFAKEDEVLSIEKTVANLNIDMIGRHDPSYPGADSNYVYIIGSNLISEELHEATLRVNELTSTGLVLDERFNYREDPNQFYARSDHWNFGKPPHYVPFVFFFTGTHEDYHRPGDEAHKIDYERLATISRLIFATAWQLANQDTPPTVSGDGFN